jgi:hypothetical protein
MSPERKKEEEEKKMPFIVATYVYASSQGQRTHSARTNLFPNQYNTADHKTNSGSHGPPNV